MEIGKKKPFNLNKKVAKNEKEKWKKCKEAKTQ
jgi:hypothetical protein